MPGKGAVMVMTMIGTEDREDDCGLRKEMYSANEFSMLTGLSMTAVRRGIRENDLPVKPVKVGGSWKFPRRPVDRLVGLVED